MRGLSLLKTDGRRFLLIGSVMLVGVTAMLGGCEKSQRNYSVKQENPPPKPPNCPQGSQTAALMLPNQKLADVRVVQVLNTKLYVPTDWLMASGHLVDFEKIHFDEHRLRDGPSEWTIERNYTPRFAPDIHFIECPGIIHHTNDDIAGYKSIDLYFKRRDGIDIQVRNISPRSMVWYIKITQDGGGPSGRTARASAADPNYQIIHRDQRLRQQQEGPTAAGWYQISDGYYLDSPDQKDELNTRFTLSFQRPLSVIGMASQWVLPEIMIRYPAAFSLNDFDRPRRLRPKIKELAAWLATPPSLRDNDRVFLLGEKSS